jgi:hypothetical protein
VIRRSRLDLTAIPAYKEDLKKQGIEFPKVCPPDEKEYDLGDLEGLYKYTIERICAYDSKDPNLYLGIERI